MAGQETGWKGCRQARARRDHTCHVCRGTIHKGHEYIVNKRPSPTGTGWEEHKRHIHCDALLRICAEKLSRNPEDVGHHVMLQFIHHMCDTHCIHGFYERCGHSGFACEQVLYALRHKPGYRAVIASAAKHEEVEN